MRSKQLLLGVLVALLPLVSFSDSGEEITLSLAFNMVKCFRHAAHVDASVVGEVLVVDGPASDVQVDLAVEDLRTSRVVLQRTAVEHEKFTLDPASGRHVDHADPQAIPPVVGSGSSDSGQSGQPHAGGAGRLLDELVEYRICVTGRSATGQTHRHQSVDAGSIRKVFFSFRSSTDVGYVDHLTHDQVLNLVSRKSDITSLKSVALDIETSVKRIVRSIDAMRERESRMFEVLSRSADEIFWYSLASCAAIVAFGVVISMQARTMLKKAVR
jgi:emp24/gp25L/p24 family/GOLD